MGGEGEELSRGGWQRDEELLHGASWQRGGVVAWAACKGRNEGWVVGMLWKVPEESCGEARLSHKGPGLPQLLEEPKTTKGLCTAAGHLLLLSDVKQLNLDHRVVTDSAWLAAAFSSVGSVGPGAVCSLHPALPGCCEGGMFAGELSCDL